ncbi:hypothetical protein BDV93DRAFT_608751 [Ceratobasidium sp. AG-I]|nr:hypothetical protein BDV93DRAFT_608751 [Ceratobasidium sp. AG-I]
MSTSLHEGEGVPPSRTQRPRINEIVRVMKPGAAFEHIEEDLVFPTEISNKPSSSPLAVYPTPSPSYALLNVPICLPPLCLMAFEDRYPLSKAGKTCCRIFEVVGHLYTACQCVAEPIVNAPPISSSAPASHAMSTPSAIPMFRPSPIQSISEQVLPHPDLLGLQSC